MFLLLNFPHVLFFVIMNKCILIQMVLSSFNFEYSKLVLLCSLFFALDFSQTEEGSVRDKKIITIIIIILWFTFFLSLFWYN